MKTAEQIIALLETEIADAKAYIEVPEMFAWTLTVILLSLLIEFTLVALLERLGRTSSKASKASKAKEG